MEKFNEIYKLLLEKKELFLCYESVTRSILSSDVEHMDETQEFIDSRQEMIDKIEEISKKVEETLKDDPNKNYINDLIANKCDASNLTEQEELIYYTSQEIFSVMNLAYRMEQTAIEMMEGEKEAILEKIKKSNREEGQKAKYMQGLINVMGTSSNRRGNLGKV